MKYVKILGLLAVAAAALMAFAATASATTLTSPTGTVYTGNIVAHSEGATKLTGSFVTVECQNSNVSGKVEKHGAGVTAGGNISSLTFENCNFPTTVKNAGSLEVHATSCKANGYCTGTVTSSGAEVSIATSVGTCIFTTNNTDVGTLTGTDDTGGHATLDIASQPIPRTGGNFLCGSTGLWSGAYTITQPSTLWINA